MTPCSLCPDPFRRWTFARDRLCRPCRRSLYLAMERGAVRLGPGLSGPRLVARDGFVIVIDDRLSFGPTLLEPRPW